MFTKFRMFLMNQEGGSDGGGSEGSVEAVAAPVVETPTVPTNQTYKPLMDYNPLLQSAPTPAAPQTPATIEELDFAGRKVQVVDPVIRDIHKDYSTLQKTYQETNLSMKSLQEQNQMYQQMIQTFQQGQQAPPSQTQPVVETPTGPSLEDNESFMSNWYENPISTVEAMIQARVDAALQPMQREKQVNTEIQTLTEKYGDFQDHVGTMQEILKTNPQLADQGLETVYFVARGQQTPQQIPTPTPEQLLSDPQFRSQLMGNEQFRNEIISSYMQNRTNANQQVPPVMGSQPGGNAPAIPENRPTTIREASRMFAKSLGF